MSRIIQPRWVLFTYWALLIVATLVLYQSSTLNSSAIWIIAVFVVSFTFGVILATLQPHGLKPRTLVETDTVQNRSLLNRRLITFTAIVGSTANVLAAIVALRDGGHSLSDVLSLSGLLESANSISVARYAAPSGDVFIAFLLGLGYLSALVTPFRRLTGAKKGSLIIALPVVTSLLYAVVSTERLGFLIAVALTVGGLIATVVNRTGEAPRIRLKAVIAACIIAAALSGAFIGIGLLRTGRTDPAAVTAVLDKQIIYSLGSTAAFSSWYDGYREGEDTQLGFGTASVAGVEYLTGQDRSATRAYNEFAYIDSNGRTSNVYTAFRGLLMDFGTAGSIVVMTLLGFAFGRVYRAASHGSIVAASALGFFYATIMLSGWLATTTFSNVLMVAIIAPIILNRAQALGPTTEHVSAYAHKPYSLRP